MRSVPIEEPCAACGAEQPRRGPDGWVCSVCGWRVGDHPDADLPPVRVEVVYYLRFGDRIKIGTSGNPRSRFSRLRFEELLAFEPGGRELERARHAQFAEYRFPGSEWFVAHDALTEHIRVIAEGVDDPWRVYGRLLSQANAARVSRG